MSDTEHNVYLRFLTDTKQVKVGTTEVSKELKKLQKQSQTIGKQEIKHQKVIKKETEVARKLNKIEAPSLKLKNNALVQQTKQMAAQTKELQKQHTLLGRMKQFFSRGGGPGGGGGKGGDKGGGGPGWGSFGKGRWFSNNRFGGFARGAVGAGAGLGALALGSLISMPIAAIGSDYQAYVSYKRSMSPLAGLAKGMPFGAGATPEKIDSSVTNMAKYGYMPDEVVRASSVFSRATGNVDDTEYGLGAARGLGMDPGEIAQIFSEMRRGEGGFGAQGKRDFQKIMSAAVKSGVDASTLPEYLDGVTSLTARAGGDLGGSVSGLPYAQLLNLFQKSGFAGLQGARGASVAAALEGMMKQPGGGAEGKAFMQASLGFGRLGGAGYYEIEKMREQGFQGKGGAGAIKRMIDLADQSGGGEQEANLYLRELSGNRIGLDQWEKIREAIGSGNQSQLEKLLQNATASELDILQKIESNTSAHAFVEAGELAAKLLKQDITRGEAYAKSIESMQQTMQDFLKLTMPAVASALKTTAKLLKDLMPVMTSLTTVINSLLDSNPFGNSSAENTSLGVVTSLEDARDALTDEMNVTSAPGALQEAEERVVAELNSTLNHIRSSSNATDAIPEFLQGRVSRQSVGVGYTEEQRATMWRMQDVNPAIRLGLFAALDQLVRSRGIEGVADAETGVDTGTEAIAALRALGININAGDRAHTDSSGGSR